MLESDRRHLACSQIKKNKEFGQDANGEANREVHHQQTCKIAVYYKNVFPETDKLKGCACKMLILLIIE